MTYNILLISRTEIIAFDHIKDDYPNYLNFLSDMGLFS